MSQTKKNQDKKTEETILKQSKVRFRIKGIQDLKDEIRNAVGLEPQ